MLGSLLDDLKAKVDGALKFAVIGVIAVGAALVAFLCLIVVLFLWMQQSYGTLEAWTALAVLFAVLATGALAAMLALRRRRRLFMEQRRRREPASPVARALQEPAILLAGLQVLRMLGARGVLPLLILGAVAGGVMLNRNGHSHREPAAAESPDPDFDAE